MLIYDTDLAKSTFFLQSKSHQGCGFGASWVAEVALGPGMTPGIPEVLSALLKISRIVNQISRRPPEYTITGLG